MENIVYFVIVITIQFIAFFGFYFYTKTDTKALPLLMKSCLVGIPFGVVFDLVIGHYAGVYTYALGFSWPFLLINGMFSYGLMMATVWCWHQVSFFKFYLYSMVLGALYEIVNYFSPVWEWTLYPAAWQEYVLVIGVASTGLTLLMALSLRLVLRVRFAFI